MHENMNQELDFMFVKVSTGINILLLVLNACNFKIHGVTSYLVSDWVFGETI